MRRRRRRRGHRRSCHCKSPLSGAEYVGSNEGRSDLMCPPPNYLGWSSILRPPLQPAEKPVAAASNSLLLVVARWAGRPE